MSLPPFAAVTATLGALLALASSALALPDTWIGAVAPRAAAEDAVAQEWYLPLHMAPSGGRPAWADECCCPLRSIVGWNYLTRAPGAWAGFQWLLRYAPRPAGRALALAGLQRVDPPRFSREYQTLRATAALPDTVMAAVGYLDASPGTAPVLARQREDVLSLIRAGDVGRDLGAVRKSSTRCYW